MPWSLSVMFETPKGIKSVLVRPYTVVSVYVQAYVTLILCGLSVRQEFFTPRGETPGKELLLLPLAGPESQTTGNTLQVCKMVQMGLILGQGK